MTKKLLQAYLNVGVNLKWPDRVQRMCVDSKPCLSEGFGVARTENANTFSLKPVDQ